MKEQLLYTGALKRIADIHYGKECLFYTDGEWYSRDHSRKLSAGEVCEYVIEIVCQYENRLEEELENEDVVKAESESSNENSRITALKAFERVEQLRKFIDLLDELYIKHSSWNEELGEGNPDAVLAMKMIAEYNKELHDLTERLNNTLID